MASNAFRMSRAFRSIFQHQPAHQSKLLLQRRAQSTATATADSVAAPSGSRYQQLMNSPVGPKTVHFWAPIVKWGVVLAGLSDLSRPAESLSLSQNAALVCTGLIWTRWCFVIKPKNMFLATVNFFVFLSGSIQCTRIFLARQSLKQDSLSDEVKGMAKDAKNTIESVVKDPKGAVKKAENV